ncbi:MAG: tetratricopeptide repeat protein, partial [Pseudomonadota bacterium]
GDTARAEEYFVQALAVYRESLPEAHPYVASGMVSYARMLGDQGRYAEAQPLAMRARASAVASLSEEHWLTAQIDVVLGVIYANTGQQDPLPLFRSGFERLLNMSGREHGATQFALGQLLDALEARGDMQAYERYAVYLDGVGDGER